MKIRKEVKEAMEVLGIDQCRRGQLEPIGKILKGKDVLFIAPTGFGKSMVYQIPAVCWADRLTLVVEPLVALMHDQVKSLQSGRRIWTVPKVPKSRRRFSIRCAREVVPCFL